MQKQPNFVSDLVRLMLIEQYGGIYLDATVFTLKPIDWALRLYESDHSGSRTLLHRRKHPGAGIPHG